LRSTFTDLEIECYRVILGNPGCTAREIIERTHFNDSRIRKALNRLYGIGAIDRERDLDGGPSAPYLYTALRGTEPFVERQKAAADQHRLKQVNQGRIPIRKGPRRNHAKGHLMGREEWEALFINYELARPGCGDLIIYEHLNMRRRCDYPPELTWDDVPRLMAEVERRRRVGRRRVEGLTAEAVRDARVKHAEGETITNLARDYGVTWEAMSRAIKGETWKDID